MEVKAWIVTTAAPEAGGRLLARDGIGRDRLQTD